MKIIFAKSTNLEWTDAIKDYINRKIAAIEKLTGDFEPVVELMIEVGKTTKHHNKGPFFFSEFTLHVPGEVLRSTEESETLYEAVDIAKDELLRQIKDYKGRLSDRTHKAWRPGKE